jgi:hypothetical protein
MRSAAVAFAIALLVAAAGLLALGLTRGSDVVYAVSALPQNPLVKVAPGSRACQSPVRVPDGDAFDRVSLTLGTYFKSGPPLRVEVRDDDSGERLGAGELAGGYPDIAHAPQHTIEVERVQTARPLRICVENEGDEPVAVYGQPTIAAPTSTVSLNGTAINADMALTLRADERSLLALLPTMADRASVFRAGWVSPAVYLVLALLLVIVVPLLLARGLARAAAADEAGADGR